ncbi:7-cyano-7-deazaguanine/7-aminomethyl-7-deazaguanine transporter [Pasteurellaceae bacterium HPA106]|uniref:7-cyano-7-deazaguanine/7-aminomethyl-7- deazaguanine transporter n=1 Tax=Spirabiliibacterium pneumoniae TaxID=221400 RepID=UPI001AACFD06|nr:7-cyano-7-deazaguanine/7-aminomethyl-7-deazaguanine transporter [Spirabiliibacterium pneumoniae]MBE2895969.1 7-cyano-7-deazaguanine/7-aminomethyl-7-deazaguanine transporter [Spirabiliibacterium pneumoniae]
MISANALFNTQQKRRALVLLSLFHILIIAASNYLVQITFEVSVPFTHFSFDSTWGTLTFPFIFLATDLTVRVFGAREARWIIFMVMIPALFISYIVSTLFVDQQFQGIGALADFNLFVFRIAFASFAAYVFGQLLDVLVFNRLRKLKTWWIAPSCSMVFGSAFDTLLFFSIAFYQSSDPFMAENWFAIGVVDYLFKLFIGLLFFVPTYGVVLNFILRKLQSLTERTELAIN